MKKMKITTMMLLILFSSCLHLHASSNPEKKNHYVDTREALMVHKNGVNPVVKRGGGGGAHGGGAGGRGGAGGGHGGGSNGNAVAVIPVYAGVGAHRSPRNQHGRTNGGHKSTALPKLVSIILALVLLLTYCC